MKITFLTLLLLAYVSCQDSEQFVESAQAGLDGSNKEKEEVVPAQSTEMTGQAQDAQSLSEQEQQEMQENAVSGDSKQGDSQPAPPPNVNNEKLAE